jgi:hypothetical protein
MNENSIWKEIFEKDPLFKPGKNLDKIIDVERVANFIASSQTEEGYFDVKSPMFYTTYLCVSILDDCGKKISENTKKYIEALQVSDIGFAEMPGEMPWTDRTYYGLKMMKIIKKEPRNKHRMIEFHQNLQNEDGGFGSIGVQFSNLNDTFQVIEILNMLGSKPKDIEKAINFINSQNVFSDLKTLYNYLNCLNILGIKLNDIDKRKIYEFLESVKDNVINKSSIEELFYLVYIQKKFLNIQDFSSHLEIKLDHLKKHIYEFGIEDLFYLVKVFKLFNEISQISEKVCEIVSKYEVEKGGFFAPCEIYIFKNNKGFHTLFLLNKLNKIDADKYLEWLIKSSLNYSWGPSAKQNSNMHHYTRSSIFVLKISDSKLFNEFKKPLVKKIKNQADFNMSYEYSSIYFAREVREILELFLLAEENITDSNLIEWLILENIKSILIKFWNSDGGFGDKGRSFMYTTFLAIRALYLAENYISKKLKINITWLEKIKDKIASWIFECQNEDGGFGAIPNDKSNVQATFYALYSLFMLNKEIKNKEKLIEWLKKHENEDGGFGVEGMCSDLLITYYVVGSFILLKYNTKNYEGR